MTRTYLVTLDRHQPAPADAADPRAAFGSEAECDAFQTGIAQRRALFIDTERLTVCLVAAPDAGSDAQSHIRQADRDPKAAAQLFAHLVRMWYLVLLGRRQPKSADGQVVVVSSLLMDTAAMGTAPAMPFIRAMHGQALVYALAMLSAATQSDPVLLGGLPACVVICPGAKEPSLCQAWRAGIERGIHLYCDGDASLMRVPVFLDPRGHALLFAAAVPNRCGVLVAACRWSLLVKSESSPLLAEAVAESVWPSFAVGLTGITSLAGRWWEATWVRLPPEALALPVAVAKDTPAVTNPAPLKRPPPAKTKPRSKNGHGTGAMCNRSGRQPKSRAKPRQRAPAPAKASASSSAPPPKKRRR